MLENLLLGSITERHFLSKKEANWGRAILLNCKKTSEDNPQPVYLYLNPSATQEQLKQKTCANGGLGIEFF